MNLPDNTVQSVDEILATIGVEGIDDKFVVGRAGTKQALLQLILSKMPGELNENGSQGKWVNGWNDYREKVVDILNELFK